MLKLAISGSCGVHLIEMQSVGGGGEGGGIFDICVIVVLNSRMIVNLGHDHS